MEQFSLEKWLQDKSRKVVTRDGRQVRIVWWELKCNTPIIAAIQWNQEREDAYCYDTAGRCANNVGELDLFFADEEGLNEFEKQLGVYIYFPKLSCEFDKDEKKYIRDAANTLINLARKELQPEFDKELEKAYKTQDDVVYRNGYAQGKQDALKAALESLPKWKKGTPPSATTLYVIRKGYYMTIEEVDELFEILPKEE